MRALVDHCLSEVSASRRRVVRFRLPWVGVVLAGVFLLIARGPHEIKAGEVDLSRQGPTDLAGVRFDPLRATTNKAVVLIFFAVDCPVCGRYAPELRRLRADYEPKGIAFWLVYPNADESAVAIRQHTRDYQLDFNVLRDPAHVLVSRAKAKVTPQAAVFLPTEQLVYAGHIDNRQQAFGQSRFEVTQRDLEETLQAVLESKPPALAWKPAIGCSISDL